MTGKRRSPSHLMNYSPRPLPPTAGALLNINLHQVINHQEGSRGHGPQDFVFYHASLNAKRVDEKWLGNHPRSLRLVTGSFSPGTHRDCGTLPASGAKWRKGTCDVGKLKPPWLGIKGWKWVWMREFPSLSVPLLTYTFDKWSVARKEACERTSECYFLEAYCLHIDDWWKLG